MMFPKPKPRSPSKPQTMNVTCNACDCNFTIDAKQSEAPECPACGTTLTKVTGRDS